MPPACDDRTAAENIVVPANDPQREHLERLGWYVSARSFEAQLDSARMDTGGLRRLIAAADATTRELIADDVDAVLTLDAATSGDYPDSAANRHEPLTRGEELATA
jgi:hypothetical protein